MTTSYPLLPSQRGLYLLDQLLEDRTVYNVPWRCGVQGPLDADRLERALARVVERHGGLRVRFTDDPVTGPRQVVEPAGAVDLAVVDLDADADEQDRDAAARALGALPFDLGSLPLFRVRLMRCGGRPVELALCFHHVVFDGWSMPIFLTDLAAACAEDHPTALPVSYGDVVARVAADAGRSAAELPRVISRLGDAPRTSSFPTDFPRGPRPDTRGATVDLALDPRLGAALDVAARFCRVSRFTMATAAVTAVLLRYRNTDDAVVGVGVGARTRQDVRRMIGNFVNVAPVRCRLGERADLAAVVAAVRDELRATVATDVSFDQIVAALGLGRAVSHHHLFQVLVSHEPEEAVTVAAGGGLVLGPVTTVNPGHAKFDLTITVIDRADAFALSADFATALYAPASVEVILADVARVLQLLTEDPSTTLGDLALVGPSPNALIEPSAAHDAAVEVAAVYEPPAGPVEARLVGMWEELLGVHGVGVLDDFFQLGGHSLLAARLVAHVGSAYGVTVSLQAVFEQPTVRGLAAAVAAAPPAGPARALVPRDRLSREEARSLAERRR